MPTTQRPPTSPARVAANRKNARLSTGPKTEAGKAIARANAVKHGLTGAGIALPTEDRAAVAERFAAIQEELVPQTVLGAFLAHEVALATVRCQRVARHETALLTIRIEEAEAAFDQARRDQATELFGRMYRNPSQTHAQLIATPEGVEILIRHLQRTIADITKLDGPWSPAHASALAILCGSDPKATSRPFELVLADPLLGNFAGVKPEAIAHLTTNAERHQWAAQQLIAWVETQVEALEDHSAALDRSEIERQRRLVADHASFDATNEATLARRYEAAAKRDLYRALREFHAVETSPPAAEPEPAPVAAAVPAPNLAPAPSPEPKSSVDKSLDQPLGSFRQPTPAASSPPSPAPTTANLTPVAAQKIINPTLDSLRGRAPRPGNALNFSIGRAGSPETP